MNKSFTLIEILTVILIVGILSGIIIVATNSVIDSTQDAKRKKDLDSISKALLEYGVMTGSYPVEASECDIGDGTCLDELIDSGYTTTFPLDPSGTRYKYSSDGITYTIKALLSDSQTLAYNPDTGYSQYTGLVGYTKRKSITINSSASLTDYQVKIDVTYDSDMQADFDDLRFTLSNGTTELSHWIESKTDSVSAVFWVKIPSLSIGDNTIYAYYGNGSASSGSNGDNTFEFFDDFLGSSLDTGKWDRHYQGTTSANVSSGYVRLYSNSGNANEQDIISKTTFSKDVVLEMRYLLEASRYRAYFSATTSYNASHTQYPAEHYSFFSIGDGYGEGRVLNTEIGYTSLSAGDDSSGVWTRGKLIHGTNSQKAYMNENLKASRTDTMGDYSYKAFVGEGSPFNSDFYIDVDWVIVRKYSSTEPSVSSWGSEESV